MPESNKKDKFMPNLITGIVSTLIIGSLGFVVNTYRLEIEHLQEAMVSQEKMINTMSTELKLIAKDIEEHNKIITKTESEADIIERDLFKMDKQLSVVNTRVKAYHREE